MLQRVGETQLENRHPGGINATDTIASAGESQTFVICESAIKCLSDITDSIRHESQCLARRSSNRTHVKTLQGR